MVVFVVMFGAYTRAAGRFMDRFRRPRIRQNTNHYQSLHRPCKNVSNLVESGRGGRREGRGEYISVFGRLEKHCKSPDSSLSRVPPKKVTILMEFCRLMDSHTW